MNRGFRGLNLLIFFAPLRETYSPAKAQRRKLPNLKVLSAKSPVYPRLKLFF